MALAEHRLVASARRYLYWLQPGVWLVPTGRRYLYWLRPGICRWLQPKVVPERRIIWDDLPLQDAMLFDDLINHYRLQKVNSPSPSFNLSVVQEFYTNVPSKFPNSEGKVFVQGIYVPFDSRVICDILGLDLSNASNIHAFYLIICHYDMKAYHRESHLKLFYRNWSDFICINVLGTSNNGDPTSKLTKVLHAMLKEQHGSIVHLCLITLIYKRDEVPFRSDDVWPQSTKDLDKGLINLSNMMCVLLLMVILILLYHQMSLKREIDDLESELSSFRKQFVDFQSKLGQNSSSPRLSHSSLPHSLSQSCMGLSSFVPQSSVCQRHVAPSSTSYFSAATFGHFGAVAAKMVVIYVAKGKGTFHEVHQSPSHSIHMAKHMRFTYSDDEEDEADEDLEEYPEEDSAEEIEATGSPLHSNASSQSEKFYVREEYAYGGVIPPGSSFINHT
ncbi:hypothetical protein DVH24_039172 [Malus domestica]|uniref:Putative plant transposon protein domain-containing protein n=1 Tax=Malus domestica TaxID=3750 RepID=A0A498KBK3_MALDO|nr:hypothetical protein DVH24_039172 [Malus domestica]